MQYWINQEGVQAGPVTREELEKMNITPNTYVWRSGLADWKKIGDLPELADLFTANASHAVPPELPGAEATETAETAETAAEDYEPQAEENYANSQMEQNGSVAQGAAWQQFATENIPECPPTNLVWAVLSIVLCCVPVGIVALVFSLKVTSSYRNGDYAKAQRMSEWSAWLCIASIVLGLVWSPFSVLIAML